MNRRNIKKHALITLGIVLALGLLIGRFGGGWWFKITDSSPEQLVKQVEHNFKGNVIIVGAGAAGLAAANMLEQHGVDYVIIEATDHYGGRVQKNDTFADFPIDTGAEWIHQESDILNRLIGVDSDEPPVELIRYNPLDFYTWDGQNYKKFPSIVLNLMSWSIPEYKFKNTTWYDFLEQNFAKNVESNIIYNSPVLSIDYSGEEVVVTTQNGESYFADKVISTVSIGVLKANYITFTPSLSAEKIEAFESVEFFPGIKLYMKFSEDFYADVISAETETGEKTYFNIAYGKESNDHVFGLLATGSSAEGYYALDSEQAIVNVVLQELDTIYDGRATATYTGEHLLMNWGQQQFTLGTWTNDLPEQFATALNSPLDNKVYFAGESHNIYGQRSSVHGAIVSGYTTVYQILDEFPK